MTKLWGVPLMALMLTACGSGPSKGVAQDIVMHNDDRVTDVKVNDMRCTEHENEEYHCFVTYETTYNEGSKVKRKAEDAIFRQANGNWESNLNAVAEYADW